MKAIILAAGRGSRLGHMTETLPKCMTELGGRPLLEWQLGALSAAGITDITLVTGYRSEALEAYELNCVYNPDWSRTNMVASLLAASSVIDGPTIISYSDIVYGVHPLEQLISCDAELAIAYDTEWRETWAARFEDPLSDAESFRVDANGLVTEIGKRVRNLDLIEGQYMGLLRLTPSSMKWIVENLGSENRLRESLDMTTLLSRLIAEGRPVKAVPTHGNWFEIDHPDDLELAERRLLDGSLRLPGWHTAPATG